MKGRQLPLAVQLRDAASFDSFYAGPNAELLAALRGSDSLLIFGPAACGKTHLLQSLARTGAAYVPLKDFAPYGAEALEGMAHAACLALDDADAVLAERDWALTLLRLLDARRTLGLRSVLACAAAPERLHIALPDLRTRLSQLTVIGVKPFSDGDRAELLRSRSLARGLEMPEEVSRYLLTRLARDTGSLLAALDQLDRASITQKRRLTLPFVQSVFAQSALAL